MKKYLDFAIEPTPDGRFALYAHTAKIVAVVSGGCPEYERVLLGIYTAERGAIDRIQFETHKRVRVRYFDADGKEVTHDE